MVCCVSIEACAAIVSAETTARRVNIAPSPVSGIDPTVTGRLPLCMSLITGTVPVRRHMTIP
jgi:hypothetical protein